VGCSRREVGKSRSSIRSLLEVRPNTANLISGNNIETVSPEQVKIGDKLLIKPGEKIPLDGKVIEGNSAIDTSALTGESIPRSVGIGEVVLAGTINQSGSLTIEVTKIYSESSIAKMLELVENASQNKAPTQKFITTFASYYTPIVVFISLAVAILPPLFIPNTDRYTWVYRALLLLVISCPCGLVISIPLGYFGGIGAAAKRGILVKGSAYLDVLTQVKTVVFDKTGTLTNGTFEVTNISPSQGYTPDRLLELAAAIESQSSHPIAKSILTAYGQPIDRSRVSNYQEISGFGIIAKIDDSIVMAGNQRLLDREQIEYPQITITGTIVHLAIDGKYAGYININDTIKPESQIAIAKLKQMGIDRTVMLTGDRHSIAAEIAQQLGLDEYQAELLPEGKLTALEKIIEQLKPKTRIAVVGDGINDAPMLARADVGIAMGGLGSDSAIETADLVIMNDSPLKLVEAIEVARKTRQIVWQNIIFALVVKGVFIILGIWGIATMWEAVFADVGVALVAIFNATRVMK
jgi:Zn2+/Cd2+-exporting ATPase